MARRTITRAAVLASVGALALAGTASASTLSFEGGRYVYTAASGEDNLLSVNYGTDAGGDYIEFGDFVDIFAGPGLDTQNCGYVGSGMTVVACDRVPNPQLSLGDLDDDVFGSPGDDSIDGGPGNDKLNGKAGNDQLQGGEGDDYYDAAADAGGDTYAGGGGRDEVTYTNGSAPVTVTLDAAANDGAGEGDNVGSDVERVVGSKAADTLVGDGGPNELNGIDGNDEIRGGGGNDVVDGDTGDDRTFGDAGDDRLNGGSGADFLEGGAGSDQFFGDGSCSIFDCSQGNDEIQARDGVADSLSCGLGTDRAVVDGSDVLATDVREACESVDREGAGGGGPGGGALSLRGASTIALRALLRSGYLATVHCPDACRIDAGLFIGRRNAVSLGLAAARLVRIGRAGKSLPAGGTTRLRVKLTRKASRKLRRSRGFTLTVRLAGKDAAGATPVRSKRVRVRGARG